MGRDDDKKTEAEADADTLGCKLGGVYTSDTNEEANAGVNCTLP